MRKAISVSVAAILAAIAMTVLVLTAAASGHRDTTVVQPAQATAPKAEPSTPLPTPGGGLEWG